MKNRRACEALLLGSLSLVLVACQEPKTSACGDLLCPASLVCAPTGDRCVLSEQVSACEGKDARAACAIEGVSAGLCTAGVCETFGCGDGTVDEGEVCDDNNTRDGDGCSADCHSDETCGNGHVDTLVGEQCDDGNTIDGDECQGDCALASCGDGALDPGEVCDDGNRVDGDGCSARCSSHESCGNTVIDTAVGEQCDDGNTIGGDGCQASCLLAVCGDTVIDQGEVCDDGNRVDGDGCSARCASDESCGNGQLDTAAGEQCDDGNLIDRDGCQAVDGRTDVVAISLFDLV